MKTYVPGILMGYFLLVSSINSSSELLYPDSVQFLHENNSVLLNCDQAAPLARTNWREYLSCKRLSLTRIWRPLSKCSQGRDEVITLTVDDKDSSDVIPSFSETYYYISENQSQCVLQNVKMIIHRCDPEAPKCNKCTLPLGIQDGRISVNQLSASSLSSNSRNANRITADDGSLSRASWSQRWCAGTLDDKQFLQVDLGYDRVITGVGTRKTDTAQAFLLKYKNERHHRWRYYKEGGNEKLFVINGKSQGMSSRHWFAHKIRARYLRFHITKWQVSLCLHVEVYGCDDGGLFERYAATGEDTTASRESKIRLVEKTLKGRANGLSSDQVSEVSKESTKYEYERRDALIVCYIASGIIAVLALIVVCKWDQMERRIRPEYLKVPQ